MLEKTMSRRLVETVVRKTLKSVKDNPERGIRNLADMAMQLSKGKFKKNFFSATQTMLQNENGAFYGLVRDVVTYTDTDALITFGMNAGYNGCMTGARQIRENEKKLGCNIPWVIPVQIDTQGFDENRNRYNELIAQGEKLGIFTWMLFPMNQPQKVLPLAESHPDSAFCLFCDQEDITPAFVDEVSAHKNLMILVRYHENADAAYQALREQGVLYSVWYQYGENDAEKILSGDLFSSTEQWSPAFTVLLPEADCPEKTRRAVYREVKRARKEQSFRTLTWELQRDSLRIASNISGDACAVCFDKDGNLCNWNGVLGSCNLFQNGLVEMLTAVCPKEAKESE